MDNFEGIMDYVNETSEIEENYKIKVIGVGGAGGKAVEHLYETGIQNVNLIIANTDIQDLENNPVPTKIQLGAKLTGGLGAGSDPETGRKSAVESEDEIKKHLEGAKLLFITAGMGGGTGSGAAPVIAQAAKEMDILTIGIVSIPYENEGAKRINDAINSIEELKKNTDAIIIINSDRLIELYQDLSVKEAHKRADEYLANATKGLAEIISVHSDVVNIDYADARKAIKDSGVAIIGMAEIGGEDRWQHAIEKCLNSPLHNNNDIRGAKFILINVFTSDDNSLTMKEKGCILSQLRLLTENEETIIMGEGTDNSLGDKIRMTIVATGFSQNLFEMRQDKTPMVTVRFVNGQMVVSQGDENDEKLNSNINDEEEQPQTITFLSDKEKREILYGHNKPKEQEKFVEPNLCDTYVLPREKLLEEEIISNIENVPACTRRQIN